MNTTPKPVVTTIIPTYRRPRQLKEAIRSVLRQTYPYFQVCVYDNASADETALVVAEIAKSDPRVKYFCHAENVGAFNNFQFGLKRVETPFFSFLSDDDLLLPDFYRTALAGFESHPDAMFSATDVIHVRGNDILRTALEAWAPGFYAPPAGLMAVLDNGHSEWTGILFRKAAAEFPGPLDRETFNFADLDFTLRIAARCPFVVSKKPGALFGCNETVRPLHPFDERWAGMLKMVGNLTEDKSLAPDVRAYAETVLLGRFEKRAFELGISYLSRGRAADARKVAVLLRDRFRGWARYSALSAIINIHQYVPFANPVFNSLISRRRGVLARRVHENQDKYREYRRFLLQQNADALVKE